MCQENPSGAAPLGVFPPHSGLKAFSTSLRSGNVTILTHIQCILALSRSAKQKCRAIMMGKRRERSSASQNELSLPLYHTHEHGHEHAKGKIAPSHTPFIEHDFLSIWETSNMRMMPLCEVCWRCMEHAGSPTFVQCIPLIVSSDLFSR